MNIDAIYFSVFSLFSVLSTCAMGVILYNEDLFKKFIFALSSINKKKVELTTESIKTARIVGIGFMIFSLAETLFLLYAYFSQ